MTPLERIAERVRRFGDPGDPATPRPLLSVEEFFMGNECIGSIGANLSGPPTPKQFRDLFEAFAKRPDVKDIRVRITSFDDPEWPFTDTVYVMTTSAPESVHVWFPEELAPDEVWEGFYENEAREPYVVPPGCRVVACWWD